MADPQNLRINPNAENELATYVLEKALGPLEGILREQSGLQESFAVATENVDFTLTDETREAVFNTLSVLKFRAGIDPADGTYTPEIGYQLKEYFQDKGGLNEAQQQQMELLIPQINTLHKNGQLYSESMGEEQAKTTNLMHGEPLRGTLFGYEVEIPNIIEGFGRGGADRIEAPDAETMEAGRINAQNSFASETIESTLGTLTTAIKEQALARGLSEEQLTQMGFKEYDSSNADTTFDDTAREALFGSLPLLKSALGITPADNLYDADVGQAIEDALGKEENQDMLEGIKEANPDFDLDHITALRLQLDILHKNGQLYSEQFSPDALAAQSAQRTGLVTEQALHEIQEKLADNPIAKMSGITAPDDTIDGNLGDETLHSIASVVSAMKGIAGIEGAPNGYYDPAQRDEYMDKMLQNQQIVKMLADEDKTGAEAADQAKDRLNGLFDQLDVLSQHGALAEQKNIEMAMTVNNGAQIAEFGMLQVFVQILVAFLPPETMAGIDQFITDLSGGRMSLDGLLNKAGMPDVATMRENGSQGVLDQVLTTDRLSAFYESNLADKSTEDVQNDIDTIIGRVQALPGFSKIPGIDEITNKTELLRSAVLDAHEKAQGAEAEQQADIFGNTMREHIVAIHEGKTLDVSSTATVTAGTGAGSTAPAADTASTATLQDHSPPAVMHDYQMGEALHEALKTKMTVAIEHNPAISGRPDGDLLPVYVEDSNDPKMAELMEQAGFDPENGVIAGYYNQNGNPVFTHLDGVTRAELTPNRLAEELGFVQGSVRLIEDQPGTSVPKATNPATQDDHAALEEEDHLSPTNTGLSSTGPAVETAINLDPAFRENATGPGGATTTSFAAANKNVPESQIAFADNAKSMGAAPEETGPMAPAPDKDLTHDHDQVTASMVG